MTESAPPPDNQPAALPPRVPETDAMLHVDPAGFAGPIDRLLELARRHRVDLGPISAVALTDQVAAALEAAGQNVRLDRQGEWLVAATWLVWLKSRLLLPRHSAEAQQSQDAVAATARRIELQGAAQAVAAWLERRPRLGRDVFARGVPPPKARHAGFVALLEAGLIVFRGAQGRPEDAVYRPDPPRRLWRVVDALARVRAVLDAAPAGGELATFLPWLDPGGAERPLRAKAAMASTFLAGLEPARNGTAEMEREVPFGPTTLWAAQAAAACATEPAC